MKHYLVMYTHPMTNGKESDPRQMPLEAESPQSCLNDFRAMFPKLVVKGIFEGVDIAEDEQKKWVRNVQLMRIETPPLMDADHDKFVIELRQRVKYFLWERFAVDLEVCTDGFYRGNHDWDNIDTLGACINGADRGSGDNRP